METHHYLFVFIRSQWTVTTKASPPLAQVSFIFSQDLKQGKEAEF